MNTAATSHCPSCGRAVGPHEACPYCGAHLAGHTPIRAVKTVAILLATIGLAVLWFAATRAEVPLIQIGQIGATMNMAYIRLEGRCICAPSYDPESDYLGFWMADDTGEIHVSAYRAETQHMIEESRVPALGDLVEVAGTLRVREDFLSLTINVPDQLKIARAEPVDRQIGTIVPEDQYVRVRVRGQIRDVRQPYEGLTLITVRDETGAIPVALGEDLVALSPISPTFAFSTSQPIEVVATVSLYGSTPQLVPASVADIVLLSQPVPVAIKKAIGELTAAQVGQLAIARGAVTEVDPFSSGVKLTLDDGTGTLIVLLWQSVYEALPDPTALNVGAQIQVQGEISQYRGELELIPELNQDVHVLTAAPPLAETTAGTLTTADVGRVVTLRGTLSQPDPFSAGVKFTLDDGTGQITLLLWSNVHESIPEGLGAGAQVVVTGEVAEYQGELELIPPSENQVQVTSAGTVPPPTPSPSPPETRAIGDVTIADVGATLLLAGTLGEPEGFSQGVKFPLGDGSGTIILLLWQNVYDAIPDTDRLVAGATVEVTGEIAEYRGDLEVIPEADGVKLVESVTDQP
jgi:DNA/RNA endonuclease YhcR with UshA esterase domain